MTRFYFSILRIIWCTSLIIKSVDLLNFQMNFSEVSDFCNYQKFLVIQLSVVFCYILSEGSSSSTIVMFILFLICLV